MDTITEVLIDAQLFFKEIEACNFSLRQEDLEFSKGVKNLDKINSTMEQIIIPSNNNIKFTKCTKEETLNNTKEILHNLYNGIYDSYIESLLPIFKLDNSLSLYDAAIAGDYDI